MSIVNFFCKIKPIAITIKIGKIISLKIVNNSNKIDLRIDRFYNKAVFVKFDVKIVKADFNVEQAIFCIRIKFAALFSKVNSNFNMKTITIGFFLF